MDVKEEKVLGPGIADHWYYVAKGRAVEALIGNATYDEILDVGAGSGIFARRLLDTGVCQRAVCVDPGYPTEYLDTHNGREINFVRSVDRPNQKLILMLDVLEHVEDDIALLRQYSEQLPADGRIIISVPAFQSLWSRHDVFLEHRRRYKDTTLRPVVRAAGLRVLKSRYYFGLLFPFFAGVRWIDRFRYSQKNIEPKSALRRYPAPINTALTVIHDIECMTLFRVNRIAGLTLFCVAGPV